MANSGRLGLDDILYGCVDHILNVFVLVIESIMCSHCNVFVSFHIPKSQK